MQAYEIQINGNYEGWLMADDSADAERQVRAYWGSVKENDKVGAIAC